MHKWRTYRHSEIYREQLPKKRFRVVIPTKLRTVVLGLGLVAFGVWLFMWSPVFRVKAVLPQGELTDAVTTNLLALAGQNLFRVSESQVLAQLRQIEPTVARVLFTRGFPNELHVTVSRHHPALIWQTGETNWAVDEEGVVFQFDPTLADGIPRVIDRRNPQVGVGQQFVSPELVADIRTAFAELPSRLGGAVSHGEIEETTRSLKLVTEWGWGVYVDTYRPLPGQFENFGLVMRDYRDQVHEYVDLRLEGWAYVK